MQTNAMTVLVDQRALFREALAGLLSKARYSAIESVASVADVPPDLPADSDALLFIVNADACQGSADDLVPRDVAALRQQYPHAHLVVLGPCVDTRDVMAALQAGADAYILETLTPDALVKSLELIMLGATVLPAEFSHAMREAKNWASLGAAAPSAPMLSSDATPRHPARLSDMEARVLARLTVGACNKEIARSAGLAEATVKTHIKAILRKINVRNRTQAALWAVKHLPPSSEPVQDVAA
jgi:two-component system nitrate/nitrite response regulator NarL